MATYSAFSDPGSTTAAALDTTSASYIGGSLNNTSSIFQNTVSTSDTLDLYRFTVSSSSSSSSIVTLILDGLSDNANLNVLNSGGNSIYSSSQTGTTSELLRTNLVAGTYYAKVSFAGVSSTNYNLSLTAETILESGRSDNSRATAFDIGTFSSSNTSYSTTDFVGNTGISGSIQDTNDYYKFTASNTGIINITLNGLGADANLELRNVSAVIQNDPQTGTTPESITYSLATATTYYVRVSPGTLSFTNYNLQFTFTSDPVDNAGNTIGAARNINTLNTTPATYSDFVNSADNLDYYRFDLASDALVNFTLTPATANADLQLLNSSGNGITSSNQSGTAQDSIRRSLIAGTYYILVTPGTGAVTNYTLSAAATPIATDQAPNTQGTAKNIGTLSSNQTFNDFVGTIDSNDWYRFSLVNNGALNLTLNGLTDNADVQLINSGGTVIQTSALTGTTNETINTNLSAGTYYVRVYPSGSAEAFYTLSLSATLQAQILEIRSGSGSSDPSNLTALGSTLYFTANDGTSGVQLWRNNGTTNTRVTNINPSGFNPANLTVFNGKLYFTANDGTTGTELWVYDGTNVQRISDINPNAASSSPTNLTVVGSNLFFTADNASSGRELWAYNGSTFTLVKDIFAGARSSEPANLTNVNGQLYFTAYNPTYGNELWTSDGTTGGTQVIDVRTGGLSSSPASLTAVGSTLYFTASDGTNGSEVWKYQAGVASLVKDVTPGNNGFGPINLTAVGSTLYFVTDSNSDFQQELWRSDGTSAGTTQVNSNITGIGALNFRAIGSTLYFTGYDSTNGFELWKSDNSGTAVVKDIWVGSDPNSSFPDSLVSFNGALYFAASDASNNRELWSSDGTAVGTSKVSNINATGNANPAQLTVVGNRLFFIATTGTNGTELWAI
ncbi:pre-peptidase C-terminal domain-containing protein [Nostoc sp. FACHB-133]|uniref:pre-peptidase C-terminal domain-containing protein n=1 Tax=Nostoc sp. FACHB-133 TaxID=2692835 RepID=UPI00168A0FE5|nr:pre-peptidase C-terminal domain-containing protein [Nostoc sp. FACHB-133]MBD2523587.1 pre-peptidase C-terminal domain-containing protein [Nostoc sp. FACHB-133]